MNSNAHSLKFDRTAIRFDGGKTVSMCSDCATSLRRHRHGDLAGLREPANVFVKPLASSSVPLTSLVNEPLDYLHRRDPPVAIESGGR